MYIYIYVYSYTHTYTTTIFAQDQAPNVVLNVVAGNDPAASQQLKKSKMADLFANDRKRVCQWLGEPIHALHLNHSLINISKQFIIFWANNSVTIFRRSYGCIRSISYVHISICVVCSCVCVCVCVCLCVCMLCAVCSVMNRH